MSVFWKNWDYKKLRCEERVGWGGGGINPPLPKAHMQRFVKPFSACRPLLFHFSLLVLISPNCKYSPGPDKCI